MKKLVSLVLVLVAVAVALAALSSPSQAAGQIPRPEDDPFYAQPANLVDSAPGAVLDSREIDATAYSLPLPAKAWQVKYRSVDSAGVPTANVTTVLVPLAAWTGTGARPLVSYQTAEDSVGLHCAPSYGLRAGLGSITSSIVPVAETGAVAALLQRGWAAVVPDYEGPGGQFAAAVTEGRGVLDSLTAVRAFAPAGLQNSPIGLTGYSGGGVATTFAAQLQAAVAPELPIKGIAMGGVVADFRATMKDFASLGAGALVPMGAAGLDRAYPEANLAQYVNAKGKDLIAALANACGDEAVERYPLLNLDSLSDDGVNILDKPAVVSFLARIGPLALPGIPIAPVYDYHGTLDEVSPIGPARALDKKFCAAGATVQRIEYPFAEHGGAVALGLIPALNYLADRFAGRPAPSNC